MAQVHTVEKRETSIVVPENGHNFNRSLNKTAADRISPTSEECIRKFAKDYVIDVIIPGALSILKNKDSSQTGANANDESNLKIFAKDYVNDVIIHGALSIIESENSSQKCAKTNDLKLLAKDCVNDVTILGDKSVIKNEDRSQKAANTADLNLFVKDYVNDVVISGALSIIENENRSQKDVSTTDLNLFINDYINDVISDVVASIGNENRPHITENCHQGQEWNVFADEKPSADLIIETKLNNGSDDDSSIIVESTLKNTVSIVDKEMESVGIATGNLAPETLTNTRFDAKQLLLHHHKLLIQRHVKETKHKVHELLERQRNNYIDLKSAMRQATQGRFHRNEIAGGTNPNEVASATGGVTVTVSDTKSSQFNTPKADAPILVGDSTPENGTINHVMSQESLQSCEILMKFFTPIHYGNTDFNKPIDQDTLDVSKQIPDTSDDMPTHQRPELIRLTKKCKKKKSRSLSFLKQSPVSMYLNVMKN